MIAPLVADLEDWMPTTRAKSSRHADVAEVIDYVLKRWESFSRILTDGRICLSKNAAKRALRGIALGRKAWLFAGSNRGGARAAAMYSLVVTVGLNDGIVTVSDRWQSLRSGSRHEEAAGPALSSSLSSRTDQPRGLALACLQPELSGCRADPGRARRDRLLREHSAVVSSPLD